MTHLFGSRTGELGLPRWLTASMIGLSALIIGLCAMIWITVTDPGGHVGGDTGTDPVDQAIIASCLVAMISAFWLVVELVGRDSLPMFFNRVLVGRSAKVFIVARLLAAAAPFALVDGLLVGEGRIAWMANAGELPALVCLFFVPLGALLLCGAAVRMWRDQPINQRP